MKTIVISATGGVGMKLVLAFLFCAAILCPDASAQTLVLKGGTTDSSKYEDALAIECPQPELPAEHNEQGIKTCCCARFTIETDGKFTVKLVSSTGSQEVDDIALATLKRWKFKPAQLNGKAIKSCRKIKIEFEID